MTPKKSPFKIAWAQGSQKNISLQIKEFDNFQHFGESFNECQKGPKHENYFVRSGDIESYSKYTTSGGTEHIDIHPRIDDAMKSASLLVIDADKSGSGGNAPHLKEISAGLKTLGYNHFGYTSHSQTETVNKCRVVIPCNLPSREYLEPTLYKLIDELKELDIDVCVNDEMKRWSQPWFFANRADPDDGCFCYEGFYDGKDYKKVAYHPEASKKASNKKASNKQKGTALSTEPKSIAELNDDYNNGDHEHGPSRSVAMILANRGHPEADITAILKQMYPKTSEKQHEQSARSAVNKAEREKNITPLEYKEVTIKSHTDIYTRHDWPIGFLGVLAKDIYENMPVANKEIAIIGARHICVTLFGRKESFRGTSLDNWNLLITFPGVGKDSIRKYLSMVLEKLWDRFPLTERERFTAFKGSHGTYGVRAFHEKLILSPSMSIIIPEVSLSNLHEVSF